MAPPATSEAREQEAAPSGPEEAGASSPADGEIRAWQMRACHFFMILVLLRLPFFDVPCAKGRCTTPLEIVAVELYSYNRAPHALIRALLYPGAFAEHLQLRLLGEAGGSTQWGALLDSYSTIPLKNAYEQPIPKSWDAVKEQQLDLVGGSFIVAFGALMAAFGPSFGPTVGMALLFVFCLREKVQIHSFMIFAAGCSLAWVPLHKLTEGNAKKRSKPQASIASKKRNLRTKGKFKVY